MSLVSDKLDDLRVGLTVSLAKLIPLIMSVLSSDQYTTLSLPSPLWGRDSPTIVRLPDGWVW